MGAYGTSQGGGAWGGLGGTPQLGNLPLRALVCDGAITGWLGYGYLRMRDYGSSLYMPSTQALREGTLSGSLSARYAQT